MRAFHVLLVLALLLVSRQPGAFELAQKDVEVFGFNVHYAEAGEGPVVIMLHGLWGGTNEWQSIVEAVAASHRVIAMDFIGFHRSDKPEAQYHNALLAQFLSGFMERLDLSDVTLMGHAMGANAATYTAYHYPERIRALVLVDGAGYRNPDRDLSAAMSERMINFRRVATGSSIAATRQFLMRRVLDPDLVTIEWAEEAFSMWLTSARAIGDMLREGGDLADEEMRALRLPTLVVWGAEDRVFSPDNAARLENDIDGAIVSIIDASGHIPQLEQPEAFLDAVLPFLQSIRE